MASLRRALSRSLDPGIPGLPSSELDLQHTTNTIHYLTYPIKTIKYSKWQTASHYNPGVVVPVCIDTVSFFLLFFFFLMTIKWHRSLKINPPKQRVETKILFSTLSYHISQLYDKSNLLNHRLNTGISPKPPVLHAQVQTNKPPTLPSAYTSSGCRSDSCYFPTPIHLTEYISYSCHSCGSLLRYTLLPARTVISQVHIIIKVPNPILSLSPL